MLLLKIETIPGQSLVEHADAADAIQCDSFNFSVSRACLSNASNQERASGEVHISEMSFSKSMDSASNALASACADGTVLGDVELHVTRTVDKAETTYLKYVLSDTMVSSISASGHGGDGLPMESFSLNFTKITSEWTGQSADTTPAGVAAFEYDMKTKAAGA